MFRSETYYRQAAGEGATYIGLLVVVYDTLAGDLRRAGEAAARGEIGARCDATNHALLLLGHLESWAQSLEDQPLRVSLGQFYGYVRTQTLALQVSTTTEGFAELATLVEETRATWQRKEDQQAGQATPGIAARPSELFTDDVEAGPRTSWSA